MYLKIYIFKIYIDQITIYMKIFYDHKIYCRQNYGGPSRYFVNLSNNINKFKNVNSKIFAPYHINFFLPKNNENKILPFSKKINRSNILKRYILKINNLINTKNLNIFKPDIVHTTYYDNSFPPKNTKSIITVFDLIHEIFSDEYGYSKNYLPKKFILENVDHIICISNSTKNDLVNLYNIDKKKISVTHLATDFDSNFKKLNLSDYGIEGKFFLYVGSRWKYKNFKKLLYALEYNKNILNEYKLILFGGGKLTKDELNIINKTNLNKKNIIHIEGDEKILKSLYSSAEFFIYTSKYEGFGIPILESFSQNCPVLCGTNSSLTEVGGNATLNFDTNDYTSIASSIEKILNSHELRLDLIKKGNKQSKLFSWKKCADETLNIYKKII